MILRFFLVMLLFVGCEVPRAVAGACQLKMSSLNFGTYSGTQLDSTTSGNVVCNGNGQWDFPLDAGLGAGATVTNRKMTGPGGSTLNYQLFIDSARTTNWGNTLSTDLSGKGDTSIVTVYGRISANQSPALGTYTDTVSTTKTSFTITVTVQATCSVTATSLTFGNYSGAQLNSTSTITANCTSMMPYNLGLDAGTAAGTTVSNRKMAGPSSSTLGYSLFSNSGYTNNWGNTVGTDTVSGTGTGTAQSLTVYGQIPAGQYVTPGSYTDTITVTLTY